MNKSEIAAALREEVGHLEAGVEKLQARCQALKAFVLELEAELDGAKPEPARGVLESARVRGVIDRVFGEKPKPRRR